MQAFWMKPRPVFVLALSLAVCMGATKASSHHSPEEMVRSLTDEMQSAGPTHSLVLRRADEKLSAGDVAGAEADYRQALSIQADDIASLYGLARVCLRSAQYREALVHAGRGVRLSKSTEDAAPFHAICARAHSIDGASQLAMDHWRRALESERPEVDWLLAHARTLRELDRHDDAVLALDAAIKKNGSVVLKQDLASALIAAGDQARANGLIKQGIEESRWRYTWLMLRAEMYRKAGDHAAANADAVASLEEINGRLAHSVGNPSLLATRSHIESFLELLSETPAQTFTSQ